MSDQVLDLTVPARGDVVRAEDFLPLLSVQQAVERKGMVNEFINKVLKEGEDYGDIPGASKKKVLLKPGAEKLCSIFGFTPSYVKEVIVEDWTGRDHDGEPLFSYEYRCQLYRGGRFMGESIGSCNSWESKYRYRWVSEEHLPSQVGADGVHMLPKRGGQKSMFEPQFAIDKAETTGKYGKPTEYWQSFKDAIATGAAKRGKKMMGKKEFDGWFLSVDETQYRIPNPDVADVINTCQKMAQKRALVAAVLVVTNCSDAFTQDIEDFHEAAPAPQSSAPEIVEEMPANMPAEIKALFQSSVPAGAVGSAFALVKAELKAAFPQNGDEEYRRILEHNGITPKGNPIAQSRNAIMQGWTLAQSVKRLQKNGAQEPETVEIEPEPWVEGRE